MVVLKQLGAGPELVHCHATLTLEALLNRAVTLVGVGGAEVVQCYSICMKGHITCTTAILHIPRAGKKTILGARVLLI